ncbi:Clp protease ClpP [Clostridium botulinum]|uniref:head maturation protease, ClpP-related n=1 Tax=Clostridium botulinum TaxID=1491 RepID=UPI0019675F9F|nr:head maturation protease, ClpP-related [Clostridium botulinum]MBN1074749.1 Clp protease ClpP [Clostridium botulinum]
MKKTWEFKQLSSNTDSVDLYIYGDVESDGYDWWWDETIESETSANHFKNELSKYSGVNQINVFVNSYGGSVYEAMAIRNQLMRHSANITGIVDGFAASAASFILTGCNYVKMYSNTMQMIHNMWMPACGNANELRKSADDLDKIMEGNRQAYLQKSNGKLTEEILIELLENETWLTAEDCLKYGLCDEVIEESVDLEAAKNMMQKLNNTFEQKVKYNQLLQKMIKEPDFNQKKKDLLVDNQLEQKKNNFNLLKNMFMKREDDK